MINIPSKQYKAWHTDAAFQIAQFKPKQPLEHANVTITLYAPDMRASDLSNKAESIMDLLVDCGFLKDDNWFVVPKLTLVFGGVDRKRPRAVVDINTKG